MLFRKKENVKLSRLRMTDGGNGGEKIPSRLALGLVAPFLIVAIFLWVFHKQALSPQPKTVLSDIPPAVVDTVPQVTEGKGTPASPAGDKTEAEKPVVETPQPVSQPINKKPPVPPKPPVKVASKKPVDKEGAVVSSPSPQKKEKKVVATPPKKEPHHPPEKAIEKNETARVIPKVEPVVIKKGRPRSPLEKEPSVEKLKPPVPSSPSPPVSKPLSAPSAPSAPTVPTAPSTPPSPASPPVPQVPKAPPKRGGGQGSYAIQMGAFSNKEDAERLAFRFKERGYDVYVVFAEIPGKGIWHRVRIGHYPDRTLAEKEAEKISNAEHLPFFITPD